MKNSSRPQNQSQKDGAVILDMDGTLLDSNAAHVHAWVEALREHGREVTEDAIRPWIGMGADNLRPFPQVPPLLERIKADGRELVVATSSAEEEVKKAIELVGVGDLLEGAT